MTAALTPHRGPVFIDVPMDVIFATAEVDLPDPVAPLAPEPDPDEVGRAAALIAGAERPAIIAGSDVYWAGAWDALAAAAEHLRVPVFANGMGRGCLPADHPLSFSRTRGLLKTDADLVVVIGTPLDFRLGFGRFGDAEVVHVADAPGGVATHVPTAAALSGDLARILNALADWNGPRVDHESWIATLRDRERAATAADRPLLDATADPIKPTRVFGELARRMSARRGHRLRRRRLRVVRRQVRRRVHPGHAGSTPVRTVAWATGPATPSRPAWPGRRRRWSPSSATARPGSPSWTSTRMVRHGLPAVLIVGNNGMWGLEKHPMDAMYGWDVACDLQPMCRYDKVVEALGGAGELVTDPGAIGPALDRAFAAGVPYLVNVVTDPDDEYPRTSSLA